MSLTRTLARYLLEDDEKRPALKSRRKLLMGGSAMAAFWAAAKVREARAGNPPDASRFLVNRLTMGFTPAEMTQAQSLGYSGYLDYQLNYTAIDDSALDTRLAAYTTLFMQPYQLVPISPTQVSNELIEASILRAVFSRRQLFERMVEFWCDHFNIDISQELERSLLTIDNRDVIRANALGSFPALLSASAHSPAMSYYLNNNLSVASNPNENYARELMELHTLGVNGGYTQNDVHEVARCFTGWQFYGSNQGMLSWTFRFNAGVHDNAAKTVLGQTIPAGGGINDGIMVLNILATHPSTANFIATKLCKRFWSETPDAGLVSAVAATYTSTSGNITEMMRTLFNYVLTNYDPANNQPPAKYKRPYHLMSSTLRATNATVTSTTSLRTQLGAAGHSPFQWTSPDGYPDRLDAWVGLILPRWNLAALLLNGNISGTTIDINALLGAANTPQTIADAIDAALFGGFMPQNEKDKIVLFLGHASITTARKRDAVGLAISSPSYQWY